MRAEDRQKLQALGKLYASQGYGPRKPTRRPAARAAAPPRFVAAAPPPPPATEAQLQAARAEHDKAVLGSFTLAQRGALARLDGAIPSDGGTTAHVEGSFLVLHHVSPAAAAARVQEMIRAGQEPPTTLEGVIAKLDASERHPLTGRR